jgi:hypothetical protein
MTQPLGQSPPSPPPLPPLAPPKPGRQAAPPPSPHAAPPPPPFSPPTAESRSLRIVSPSCAGLRGDGSLSRSIPRALAVPDNKSCPTTTDSIFFLCPDASPAVFKRSRPPFSLSFTTQHTHPIVIRTHIYIHTYVAHQHSRFSLHTERVACQKLVSFFFFLFL